MLRPTCGELLVRFFTSRARPWALAKRPAFPAPSHLVGVCLTQLGQNHAARTRNRAFEFSLLETGQSFTGRSLPFCD